MTAPLGPDDDDRPHRRVAIEPLEQDRPPALGGWLAAGMCVWFLLFVAWMAVRLLDAWLAGRFPGPSA